MADDKTATILGPDGTPVDKPVTRLSFEDAELLKAYQAWGERSGYWAEMFCGDCQRRTETYVQGGQIGIFCDCRVILWQAS